jgi:hypothetical protein
MNTGSTSGVINVAAGTPVGGVIAALYLKRSSIHDKLITNVCQGIGVVGISTMVAVGMAEASGMAEACGVVEASGMAEASGMTGAH